MEMGSSDNDGGLGVGVFFGGLGLVPTLVLLAIMVGISMHCNARSASNSASSVPTSAPTTATHR